MKTDTASQDAASEYQDRLKKLAALKARGIDPYPPKGRFRSSLAEVCANFPALEQSGANAALSGRLRSKRSHGNLIFARIESNGRGLQLAFSKKEIGAESFKDFERLADTGDFIEASGTCFITHKGENSLMVKEWRMLAKSLRPLPDKWHGLKDEEERYRKRYLDLLFDPELRDVFAKRARFWEVARAFMKERGFAEVETPTLELTTGGAEAAPFKTRHDDYGLDLYLRISIGELWQKRLMAAGYEKTFEIGRVYRNEGSSPDHLQEFTNLEFYWAYADFRDGMALARELFRTLAKEVFGRYDFSAKGMDFDLSGDWPEIDYREEVRRRTGIDVLADSEGSMRDKLAELGVVFRGENRERLTDSLWKYCRKSIAGPAFLVNHPRLVSPLAKASAARPEAVERFHIIIAGTEIGNGYSELNDPLEQRARFEAQEALLRAGDKEAMMPDWEFVEMLEYGMPPTCGFGFGERLFALLAGRSVREATLFPLMKPKAAPDKA